MISTHSDMSVAANHSCMFSCVWFSDDDLLVWRILEMRIVTMHNEKLREQRNYLCPPDRRRPNPLRVCSDKQCSTLVDNVLSRYACKQCCDVQHVGLGHVGSLPWLATSVSLCLPSLCSGRVPDVLGSNCICVPERFSLVRGSNQHVDMFVKPWTLKRNSEFPVSV